MRWSGLTCRRFVRASCAAAAGAAVLGACAMPASPPAADGAGSASGAAVPAEWPAGHASIAIADGTPGAATNGSAANDLRLLVKLAGPPIEGAEVARRAAEVAGVPVRHLGALGPEWHALGVACRSTAECDAARRYLRTANHLFAAVEDDLRRRVGP